MANLNEMDRNLTDIMNRRQFPHMGPVDMITGDTSLPSGLSMNLVYNNGYPCAYGNVLNLHGYGGGQILVEWSGTSGDKGRLFFRNQRDVSGAPWSEWSRVWAEGDAITNAVWNDYAEYFEKNVDLVTEPGDIIALDLNSEKEEYRLAVEGDTNIIGVHSDEYGMLLGGTEDKEYNKTHFILTGLTGRVKTKIIGSVIKGDRIVPSSIPGVGRKYNPSKDDIFSIVGYVTETNLETGIKKVRLKLNTF